MPVVGGVVAIDESAGDSAARGVEGEFEGTECGELPERSRCLYSYWKGYLEKPDWVRLQEQLRQVGGDFIPAHASGHIYAGQLIELIGALQAKKVLPIHTFEPGKVEEFFSNTLRLQDGESYEVGEA